MSNHRRGFYGRLLCGAAVVSLMTAAVAQAEEQVTTFNIAPQPLSSALNEFATQSKTAVLFTPELTGKKFSPGLTEVADAESALRRMLVGADLTYRRNGDTFIIMRADDPQGGSAAGGGAEVEALIVTAQKREEDIQDVPIAISAFSQEALETHQIAGGPDLITQVPNMTFTKTNFSSYSIQIRGIGTQAISATTDPAVAVAFNNTPFIRNRFFEQEFYDLQRVEVLRGPQGTLYGRNATAGVVNIISAKPKFFTEAKLSGDLSNYNSSRLEGMVNIPIVEDVVAVRLAGAWTKRDGYATNEISGNPIDGRDLWSTRLSVRFAPTDNLDFNLIWEHFEEDDDRIRSGKQLCKKHIKSEIGGVTFNPLGPFQGTQQFVAFGPGAIFSQGCERTSLYSPEAFQTPFGLSVPYYIPLDFIDLPVAGNSFSPQDPYVSQVQSRDLRVIESTVDPHYKADADIGEFQISWDITDSLTLASETAYGTETVWSTQDFNRFNTAPGAWDYNEYLNEFAYQRPNVLTINEAGNAEFCDPQIGCSDRLVAVDLSTGKSRQFSQEFRLSSDFDGPFNFNLGANYLRYDGVDKYYVFINSLTLSRATRAYDPLAPFVPWIPGVSTNREFMNGLLQGDPGRVHFLAGTYIDPNPIENLNDQGHNYFLSKNPYKLISYAIFGESYYNLTDTLKVTAGLRWSVDKKEAPRIPSWTLIGFTVGYPVYEVIEQEWREPTGRLVFDWKPDLAFTDETMAYASYAHGYKAGGANPPPFVPGVIGDDAPGDASLKDFNVESGDLLRPKVFEPEFVDAFELGTKNTFLGGTATINLAAFYYDYKGYQISEIVDRSAYNRNFDTEVWGGEIEADWRPLENLKLGFKGGYQKTRIRDGEEAIDLMDRTAGNPDWVVVRPYPIYPSSCIIPVDLFVRTVNGVTALGHIGNQSGGGTGACEMAYKFGLDPLTGQEYTPGPYPPGTPSYNIGSLPDGYLGFDPSQPEINGGDGFAKQLGGNELPNAPNWTATITADYTLPLPNDWLATLHTDLHWQSESWWRVFNDHEFNRLDEYFTMNLAAIFNNEERGWRVMAYIKNVTDETAITGAFLNSDDTALTTNVFLTEPRLYGLRVTKQWTGGSLLGSFGSRHEGPYPWTVEMGGQVQRHEADNAYVTPTFIDEFSPGLHPMGDQDADLDWGDGREVKLTYQPGGSWKLALAARYGKTNGSSPWIDRREIGAKGCGLAQDLCDQVAQGLYKTNGVGGPAGFEDLYFFRYNYTNSSIFEREEHTVIDFTVGKDFGIGLFDETAVSAGIRYASLKSKTNASILGNANWDFPVDEDLDKYTGNPLYPVIHDHYELTAEVDREFKGVGPVLSWDASQALLGNDEIGHLGLDWSLTGGVLFGKRKVEMEGEELWRHYSADIRTLTSLSNTGSVPTDDVTTPLEIEPRSEDVTVPTWGASLGLSYKVDRFKVGAGYRWETYQDAIDGGYGEAQEEDRTIDGPYFKLSVGFGGG